MSASELPKSTVIWDKIGITASLICAIHCMTLPIVLPFLAVWSLGILSKPGFELAMIVTAVLIGVFSVVRSYWRHHRRVFPFYFIGTGLLLLILAKGRLSGEELEPIMVPIGAVCIALAHGLNWKLCKSCPVCRETIE